MVIIINL